MVTNSKIFIYGVPGSGKTTFSRELEKELKFPLVEADELRKVAKKDFSEAEKPFVYLPTTDAFRHFGEFNEENIIKGFQEVRQAFVPYLKAEIGKYPDSLIMEAAFLDPNSVGKYGQLVLIVESDEQLHLSHFFEHRQKDANFMEKFRAARIIQKYLLEEVKGMKAIVIENDSDMEGLKENFMSLIK